MRILLTNDDSHRSPLLEFVIEYLEGIADLTCILPAHEQSWKGKAITRFENLHLGQEEVFGRRVHTLSGTPADCINYGIHRLLKTPPDLVVSGINAGRNTGISFLLSSGTVGACLESNIAGVPAIALSQEFNSEVFAEYIADYNISEKTRQHLSQQTREILERNFSRLIRVIKASSHPMTWSMNFPFHVRNSLDARLCSVAHNFYAALFQRESDIQIRHKFDSSAIDRDPRTETDDSLLGTGEITLSVIDIRQIGQVSEEQSMLWEHVQS